MTKKILAVLLALAMVLSLVSVNVFAAEEVETAWTTGTISNETKVGWATAVPSSAIGAGFIEALSKEGATLVIHTDLAGEDFGEWGWSGAFVLQAAEGDWDQTSQLREQLVIDKKETGTDVSISGADVIADLKETISGYETISQWQIVLNTDANDGKSLACETYVVTGAEITVPKASEGEGDTGDTGDDADLEVVWELAAPVGEIGSKTTSDLFGTQHAAFLEAINTEGAVFEITVTNPSENGMMTNIFADGSWNNAYVAAGEGKWPSNGTFTYQIPAADLMEKAGITEITNMRLQFGIYGDDTVKISLDSAKVLVPKSGDEDGTTVKLEKATWDGGKQGNFQINIPLDDVNAVKDPSTIESFVVELTVTGAVADGEKIDVTKIGSDVAIMDPWTAAGLYISPEADGTLKLEVPAAKIGTSNNWIIQLYIDGENLPSGLDTKEASLTYKDFKITINYKPEPEECDHEDDYDATEVKGTVDTEKTTFTPDEELTDATLVHIEFEEPAAADGTVTVNYAEVKEPVQKPEGTEYALEKNGTYNWAYTYMWETLATVLKDIDPNEALKYDDVEITLEIAGAIADGELIDASKVHGNLVVQPKWSGWISIADTVADANGVINIKADLTQFKNETTDATSQVISQLYIDPADLPNGLDGTKEATIYVKSATIRIGSDTYSTKPTTTPSEPTKPEYEEVTGYTAAEFAKDHQDADGVITFNEAWSDCPGFWWGDTSTFGGYDSVEIVVEAVSNYTQYRLAYVDGENVDGNFSAPSTITIDIDPTKMIKQLYVQSGAAGNTVKISSIKWRKAAAATPATVAVSEGVPVGASVPAPATATFKAGDPCVTVEVDPDLVIESIAIDGAKIAKVEVLTKKATKPTNPAIPGLPNVPGLGFGYPIQLGNEYHGFLLADGSMITMPHEFNANGFCTVCGYTVLNNSTPATDVTVDVPTEAPETQEDDTEGDDMNVSDEVETPKEDENPKTGLALAVLPMLAAAAVAAASRKH